MGILGLRSLHVRHWCVTLLIAHQIAVMACLIKADASTRLRQHIWMLYKDWHGTIVSTIDLTTTSMTASKWQS